MARMKFICDAERCIECNGCVTACKAEHKVPWGVNRRRVVTLNDGVPDRDALAEAARRTGIRVADDDTWSDLFSKVLVETIEPHLGEGRPTVLYEYPAPEAALARAFGRLDAFTRDPLRLGRNAVKAGFTFNLLDMGRLEEAALPGYLASIPFLRDINRRNYGLSNADFASWLLREVVGSRAARVESGWIIPTGKA